MATPNPRRTTNPCALLGAYMLVGLSMWTVDTGIFGRPAALNTTIPGHETAKATHDYTDSNRSTTKPRKEADFKPWFLRPSEDAQSPGDTDPKEKKDMERKTALVFMLHVATDGIRR